MLASAGILKGRRATSFFAIRDDVANAGAEWLDREVVVDGNLVTSRAPGDLPAFCDAIERALEDAGAGLDAVTGTSARPRRRRA